MKTIARIMATLSLLLGAQYAVAANRAIMEGIPATNSTLFVSTQNVSVGVGTTTPKGNLDINGSALFGGNGVNRSTFTANAGGSIPSLLLSSGAAAGGPITAPYFLGKFIGSGSLLTGITLDPTGIVPNTYGTGFYVGQFTAQSDGRNAGAFNVAIQGAPGNFSVGSALSAQSMAWGSGPAISTASADGSLVLAQGASLGVNGPINSGDLNSTGTVTANYFKGDGHQLYNVTATIVASAGPDGSVQLSTAGLMGSSPDFLYNWTSRLISLDQVAYVSPTPISETGASSGYVFAPQFIAGPSLSDLPFPTTKMVNYGTSDQSNYWNGISSNFSDDLVSNAISQDADKDDSGYSAWFYGVHNDSWTVFMEPSLNGSYGNQRFVLSIDRGGNLSVSSGSLNVALNANVSGTVTAAHFSGSGDGLSSVPPGAISNGALHVGVSLSTANVVPGFNGPNEFLKLDGSGALPAVSGANLINSRSGFITANNGTLGVGTFSFGYSGSAVTISSMSIIVTVPGSGGSSGTIWACCYGGSCVSATSAQGAAAGSTYTGNGSVSVPIGGQIVLEMESTGEATTPTVNAVCGYQ